MKNQEVCLPAIDAPLFASSEDKGFCIKPKIKAKNAPLFFFFKRFFDIFASVFAGAVLIFPMTIIAVLIKLDSPGPVFYLQERLGKNGKPFMIYKFRSMRTDAEKSGPCWASKNDSRSTKFGSFIRKTRIDELPQLLNIFKGEMSFVGPRPERACFYKRFEEYISGFSNRLAVKPGLTGLAQVSGGYDLPPEEKIVFDMEYIEKMSFWLDLKCIFMTFPVIFFQKGAR